MQIPDSLGPLGLLLLAGIAFFVEKHHTTRWTVAADSVILLSIFGTNNIFGKEPLNLYLFFSVIAAIFAVFSYINNSSLTTNMHKIFYYVYGSKTVLGIVLALMLNIVQYAVIPIIAVWVIAIKYFNHPAPL